MEKRGRLVQTPYDVLTYRINGCAMAVHRALGPGLKEKTYQRALEEHLLQAGLSFEAQKLMEVCDPTNGNVLLGYYIPDFVVENQVVVEIKALNRFENSHIAQVIGYLAITGCPVGLLINFGLRSLQHQRIFPPENIRDHQVNRQWLFVPDWLKSER